MALAQSKLTAQGQISVPAEVRRKLGLGPGSVLVWEEEGDHIVVRRSGRCSSQEIHDAIFSAPPAPRSGDQIKAGIRRRMKARHARD